MGARLYSEAPQVHCARIGLIRHDSVHSKSLLWIRGPVESTDESNVWRTKTQLHRQAGPVSGLHRRLHPRSQPAARRTRNTDLLRRHPALSAPDDPHSRTRTSDPSSTRRPTQHRSSRAAPRHPRLGSQPPTCQNFCDEELAQGTLLQCWAATLFHAWADSSDLVHKSHDMVGLNL